MSLLLHIPEKPITSQPLKAEFKQILDLATLCQHDSNDISPIAYQYLCREEYDLAAFKPKQAIGSFV